MITFVYSRLAEFSKSAKPAEYFLDTEKNWILQTYLKLRSSAFPVEIAAEPPEEGTFVACAYKMNPSFIPSKKQFFISVSADGPPHFGADMHIVQNKAQSRLLPSAVFVPHWPQPGLVGRDPSRGAIFENVAYIGDATNLDPALRSPDWTKNLEQMGINWIVPQDVGRDPADMSDIDAVVAIRSFRKSGFMRKPASKLVNALLADVPAICGPEFAFSEVGQPGSCFLNARSVDEALRCIEQLKLHPELRRRLAENGRLAVRAYNEESVHFAWQKIMKSCVSGKMKSRKSKYPQFRALLRRKFLGLQYRLLKSMNFEHLAI